MKNPTAPLSIGLAFGFAIGLLLASIVAFPAGPAQSREPDKTLKLFFGHTGETRRVHLQAERPLRPRRDAAASITSCATGARTKTPRWTRSSSTSSGRSTRRAGSRDYIHVVSAYRSPATNEMLRSPLERRRQEQPAPARQGDGLVPARRAARQAPRDRHEDAGRRRRLLSALRLALRAHRHRQRARLAAHVAPAARSRSSRTATRCTCRPTASRCRATSWRSRTASSREAAPALAYLDTDPSEAEETDRTGTERQRRAAGSGAYSPATARKTADVAEAAPADEPARRTATTDPQQLVASEEDDVAPLPRSRPAAHLDAPAEALAADNDRCIRGCGHELGACRSSAAAHAARRATPSPIALARRKPRSLRWTSIPKTRLPCLPTRLIGEPPAADPSSPVSLAFADAGEARPALRRRPGHPDGVSPHSRTVGDPRGRRDARRGGNARSAAERRPRPAEPQDHGDCLCGERAPAARKPYSRPSTGSRRSSRIAASCSRRTTPMLRRRRAELIGLIETPRRIPTAEAGSSRMPSPESELYRPPEAASEVADLRSVSPGRPSTAIARDGETPKRGRLLLPALRQPDRIARP